MYSDKVYPAKFTCGHTESIRAYSGRGDFSEKSVQSYLEWAGKSRECPTCTKRKEDEKNADYQKKHKTASGFAKKIAKKLRSDGYYKARPYNTAVKCIGFGYDIYVNVEQKSGHEPEYSFMGIKLDTPLSNRTIGYIKAAIIREKAQIKKDEETRQIQATAAKLKSDATAVALKMLASGEDVMLTADQCKLLVEHMDELESYSDY